MYATGSNSAKPSAANSRRLLAAASAQRASSNARRFCWPADAGAGDETTSVGMDRFSVQRTKCRFVLPLQQYLRAIDIINKRHFSFGVLWSFIVHRYPRPAV
jgi:hypothetical protein